MNHSSRLFARFVLLLILLSAISAYAQEDPRLWDLDGVPFRLGDHMEWLSSSAVNEYGQTCVTWADAREGYWDIYAQVIAPNGSQLWEAQGVTVNNAIWRQEEPLVIAVDGGWVIAWMDWRYGDRYHYSENQTHCAIFAQKLSLSGERLWPDDGVEISGLPIRDGSLRLSDDRSGGAIIGWRGHNTAEGYFFKTQRVNAAGNVMWPEPVTVTDELDWRSTVQVAHDDTGNMLAVWLARVDTVTMGVFAAKVTPSGVLPWGDGLNGVRLGSTPGNCYLFDVCRDETNDGFYVAWCDRGTGYVDYTYYGQRFTVDAQPLWGDTGALLIEADEDVSSIIIAPSYSNNAQDGFLLVGHQYLTSEYYAVVQKVDVNGNRMWGEDCITAGMINYFNGHDRPRIQSDFEGGCIIAWNHYQYIDELDQTNDYLMASRFNEAGTPLWGTGGITVHQQDGYHEFMGMPSYVQNSNFVRAIYLDVDNLAYKSISFADGSQISETPAQIKPIIYGEAGGPQPLVLNNSQIAVIWADERSGKRELFLQVTDTLGSQLLAENGVRFDPDPDLAAVSWYSSIVSCSDGNGGFFISTTFSNGSNHPLILYHVTFDEALQHHFIRNLISDSARGHDDYFNLTSDGDGGCYLAWNRYTPDFNQESVLQRFNAACQPIWPEPEVLTVSSGSRILELSTTSEGSCIAAYLSTRNSIHDVSAVSIDHDGNINWLMDLMTDASYNPVVACQPDNNGGMYFCWDNTNSLADRGIYLQHTDANGILQWPDGGVHVDVTNGWDPRLLFSEQYGIYIVWLEGLGIRAQRLDFNGTRLWGEEGLLIGNDDYAEVQDIAFNDTGGLFCIWTQYDMYSSSMLYGMNLTMNGAPADPWWNEGLGTVISTDNRYAFNARLAPFRDGTSMIVWEGQVWGEEEYSAEKPNFYYYIDIYAQRIAVGENTLAADPAPHSVPVKYALHQNYPNPFNPATTIAFTIPQTGHTSLIVYDLLGRTVETLLDKQLFAGNYHIMWNAEALPSGVYFYRLTSGDFVDVKKTILLK